MSLYFVRRLTFTVEADKMRYTTDSNWEEESYDNRTNL